MENLTYNTIGPVLHLNKTGELTQKRMKAAKLCDGLYITEPDKTQFVKFIIEYNGVKWVEHQAPAANVNPANMAKRMPAILASIEGGRLNELNDYHKELHRRIFNPDTPAGIPQIPTETAKITNVSTEGENTAETAKYRVSRFGGYKIIIGNREQDRAIAILMSVNGHNTIEISDESAGIATMGEKSLLIDKPIMRLSDAEVLELIYNHSEPPQSPENPQAIKYAFKPRKPAQTA